MRIPDLLLLAAAAACGEFEPAMTVRTDLRSAAALDSLTLSTLVVDAPLCTAATQSCLMSVRGYGVVSPRGDVVILAAGGRRPLVALIRAGESEAITLGRDGSGPGEYQLPGLFGFAPDGDVLVMDVMSRRVLRYAPDGSSRSTALITLPPAPLQTGSGFAFVGGELRMLSADRADAQGDTLPVHLFALDSGASPARRLRRLDVLLPAYGLSEFMAVPPAFAPTIQTVLREDGSVIIARGERLELELFDESGAKSALAGFRVLGREVTLGDVQNERAQRLRGVGSEPMRAAIELSLANVAPRHPAVTKLVLVGDDGVWLRQTPRVEGDSVQWVVFDRDLQPTRRLLLSVADEPIGCHADRCLIARSGDDEASTGYWWMRIR